MKYIKSYENVKEPKVGDYVIAKSTCVNEYVIDFVKNNIGQIIKFKGNKVFIKYKNCPPIVKNTSHKDTRVLARSSILYFSESIEELELILASKKYNL